jgi:23S rRNA pseudouridine2605 synthase
LRNWTRVHPMKDYKKTNKSAKSDKKSSPSSEKKNYKPVNNKFTKDRNSKSSGNFKKSDGKPSFFGARKEQDSSDSPRRSFPRRDSEGSGERKPFNRGPRREGGEGNGERKPFNRSFPRRDSEGSGERKPFNRGPRREGGEGNGERKPFNRSFPRRDSEGSGERKPFNRGPRREGGEGNGERKPFNRSFPRRDGEGSGERKPFNRGPRREGGEGNGERKPFNRSFPRRDSEGSGERKPFNRGPRREGGEGNGERKPFNRSFPRRDGEGSGERKPFNRGPRRDSGEGNGERKPFNRSFPRRDGESSAERKPFPRREREPFRERPVASFDGEELPEAAPEKREVRRYKIDPEEMKQKSFPKTNKKIKVRKDKEEGILQSKDDEKAALLARLKEDSILGSERNFTDGTEQTVFRINRFLAKCGLGARRDVEDYIRSGQIRVNGEEETSLSRKIDITKDTVEFNGEKVELVSDNTILALNKPEGYLCSHHDVHHDKTVFNLLPLKYKKFNMAGRLDLTSRGLMIFSANGDVLNQISHPSYDVKKRYLVQVDKPIEESDFVEIFLKGIEDEGEYLRAKEVRIVDKETRTISIMLQEGKKRQIHRMFQAIGYKVIDLQRVQIGKLLLEDLDLPEGKFKEVKLEDIFG